MTEDHAYRVNVRVFEKFGVRGIALGNAVFLHKGVPLSGQKVGAGNDGYPIKFGDGITVSSSNAAKADHSYS